ncbi:hypothetical protein [uncultured Roseovarius sp.]|uniref:hypothetical protein n=1 Tax=uncultured Roseovarius sp. TaxID=293344 RepID=UPI00260A5FF0|nr:hypothetical protein [uncultured Roseovarius sp.]
MSRLNPQTAAKNTAAALLREAREAGWLRAKFEIRPDGSVSVDAGMSEPEGGDDFLSSDLRMGE